MTRHKDAPMSHLTEYLERMRDNADLTTHCTHCNWTFSGTAADARLAARDHRERFHPKRSHKKGRRNR